MKKVLIQGLLLIILATVSVSSFAVNLRTNSAEEVVAHMTPQQKAWMLVGAAPYQTVPGAAGTTYGIPELGIPTTSMIDGPLGVSRYGKVTAFPGLHVMAQTWNTDLIYEAGAVLGDETAKHGFDSLLGPGADIQRNPLAGRNSDYFSEDPVQTGLMASAYVNGLQSKDVMASVKHYAANVAETLRERNDTVVGERALREIFLRNYELIAKLSNPGNYMTTYNLINNEFVTGSSTLLTEIVKNEWNYSGIFVSDWFSGDGLGYQSIPILVYEYEYDTWMQVAAGCHLQMPGGSVGTPIDRRNIILNKINSSSASMKQVDKLCVDILNYVKRTATFKGTLNKGAAINYEGNAAVARRVAEEGSVLLKNDNHALPIQKSDEVALFGYAQIDTVITVGGSAAINEDTRYRTVRIYQGFTNAGIKLNEDLLDFYNSGLGEAKVSDTLIDNAAKNCDVAIYVVRKTSAEWGDREPNTNDFGYYLPEVTLGNIRNISAAFHAQGKKLVVIINSTGPIDVSQWEEYVDGIVYIGTLGNETGTSVVNLLTGDSNFSGKLAQIFPKNYYDIPGSEEFPGVLSPSGFYYNASRDYRTTHINEGIYVGHRYFTTFDKETSYPFGYGLSYTDFEFSNMTVNGKTAFSTKTNPFVYTGGNLTVTVDVTNIGTVSGKEVAQFYIHASETSIEVPEVELKGFAKSANLHAGQSQTLSVTITPELLKSYQVNGAKWIIPKGKYELRLGRDSETMVENACFIVEEDILVQQVTNQGTNAHSQSQLNEISKANDGGLFDIVYINDTWEFDGTSAISPFGQAITKSGFYQPVTVISGTKTFTKVFENANHLRMLKFVGEAAPDTKVYLNGTLIASGESICVKTMAPDTETITVTVVSSGFGMEIKGVFAALADTTELLQKIEEANQYLNGDYSKSSLANLSECIYKAEDLLLNGLTTKKFILDAIQTLQVAIDNLAAPKPAKNAYNVIAAIHFDDKADVIQVEDDLSSIGYVVNGSWVTYEEVAFGEIGADALTISYGMPEGFFGNIRILLDDPEIGEVILQTYLNHKSTTWKDFRQETFQLNRTIRGTHDIYVYFYEDNGSSCANFEYFKFNETTPGSKAYIQKNMDSVRLKQAEATGEFKAYLTKCVKILNQYNEMASISQKEEQDAKTRIDKALSPKSEFNFYFEELKTYSLHAYEEGTIAEAASILVNFKAYYEDEQNTANLSDYVSSVKSAFEKMVLRSGYPYRNHDATRGISIGDPFTIKDGYLSVLNAAAKVDLGVMNFGKAGSQSVVVHYRNHDASIMNLYFYTDETMQTPIGSMVLRATSEDGFEEVIDLTTILIGEHHIYAKIIGKGNAGFDTFRFIENENRAALDAIVNKSETINAASTDSIAYAFLQEYIDLSKEWISTPATVSSSLTQNIIDVLSFYYKEAEINQNPWRDDFGATSWDEASDGVHNIKESGIFHTTGTQDGDYIAFKNLNFGDKGTDYVTISYACPEIRNYSRIELRTVSPSGPVLATYDLMNTESWSNYKTDTIRFYEPILGTQTIYVVFRHSSANTDFCNFYTFSFHQYAEKIVTGSGGKNPYTIIEAADYDVRTQGISKIPYSDSNGNTRYYLGKIKNNEYVGFKDYNFAEKGAIKIRLHLSSVVADATVTVRLDSSEGPVVGQFTIGATGDFLDYADKTFVFALPLIGKQTFYLVFNSNIAQGEFLNIQEIQFIENEISYVNAASHEKAERMYAFFQQASISNLTDMPLFIAEQHMLETITEEVISALGESRYRELENKYQQDKLCIEQDKAAAFSKLVPIFCKTDKSAGGLSAGTYCADLYGIYEEKMQWMDNYTLLYAVYQGDRIVRVVTEEELLVTESDDEIRAFVWSNLSELLPKTVYGILEK